MKISVNWLREYISLPVIDKLVDQLPMVGLEVDTVETVGLAPLDKVVVGEIKSSKQHPNADRLSVCEVDVGGDELAHIVCGAKNYQVGDRVPVALPGAELPGGFKIKRSKLRGEVSEGMMCSARELGLGDDHAGLLILEQRPAIGTPVNEVFAYNDTVLDIEITPNRADCLSHVGIARELAALQREAVTYPETSASPHGPFRAEARHLLRGLTVKAPDNCPHYLAYAIRGVKVGPSPEWLQQRLTAIGLRPINNVVDVTNYVLHELGQPLHAFDAAKIRGDEIIVRQAEDGEKITTLDDRERTLDREMTVIADAERALVVAGVMGSVDAEVDESTTDIVLEVAYFAAANVRRTSRRLGLSTDSSYRFERGVDPRGLEYAALRAIDLILETAGGELAGPPLEEGEAPFIEREIRITGDYVRARLGFDVTDDAIAEIWEALDFDVVRHEDVDPYWLVRIPSYRNDIDRRIDLVEEFLRIYGTTRIPDAPVEARGLAGEDDPLTTFTRAATDYLVGQHFHECIHYTMRSADELRDWYSNAAADLLGLANPLVSDQSHLRASVLPGLLDALQLNVSRRNHPWRLFETGHSFREHHGAIIEVLCVGFVVVTERQGETWRQRVPEDFYQVANWVTHLLAKAGITVSADDFAPLNNDDPWQSGHAASVGSMDAGFQAKFGLLNLVMTRAWDIPGPVQAGVLYLSLDKVREARKPRRWEPFSPYPPVARDLALLVPTETPAGQVRREVESVARAQLGEGMTVEAVVPFDVYTGEGLPEGKKSLAFNLVYRAPDRTLTDEAVNAAFTKIAPILAQEHGYQLRG